jgi:hypothetical protein
MPEADRDEGPEPLFSAPRIDRPLPVAIAILHLKGWWARKGDWILDRLPLVVVLLLTYLVFFRRDPSLDKLGVVAAGAAIVIGFRAALRPGAVLAPIVLPKILTDAGWNGELVSRRIIDAAMAQTSSAQARGVVNPFQPFEPVPKLEVPGFKLDPDTFGDMLRELAGKRRMRIGGEIVTMPEARLSLRLRGPAGMPSIDCGPVPQGDLTPLFDAAASVLLTRAAPYNLAYARQREGQFSSALHIAQQGGTSVVLGHAVRLRCLVLCWHQLRALGRFREANEALTQAAVSGCTDLMVTAAVGEQLKEQGETANPWDRLGTVAHSLIRGKEDLDHFSISYARKMGELVQSYRRSAWENVDKARQDLFNAHEACWKLRRQLVHPWIAPKFLGETAQRVDHCLKSADDAMDRAQEADREETWIAELVRLRRRHRRLTKIRTLLTNDRVRQGESYLVEFSRIAKEFFTGIGKIAEDLGHDLARFEEQSREGSLFMVTRQYKRGVEEIMSYRRKRVGGGNIWHEYWHAIDTVLESNDAIEMLVAKSKLSRRHAAELKHMLRGVNLAAYWLSTHPPIEKPIFFDVPLTPPPSQQLIPDVETSPSVAALRKFREDNWEITRKATEPQKA